MLPSIALLVQKPLTDSLGCWTQCRMAFIIFFTAPAVVALRVFQIYLFPSTVTLSLLTGWVVVRVGTVLAVLHCGYGNNFIIILL